MREAPAETPRAARETGARSKMITLPAPPRRRPRMETLQDDCPHEDVDSVKALIAKSLGRPFEEVFEWIEDSPLGSASIGQARRDVFSD